MRIHLWDELFSKKDSGVKCCGLAQNFFHNDRPWHYLVQRLRVCERAQQQTEYGVSGENRDRKTSRKLKTEIPHPRESMTGLTKNPSPMKNAT